MIISKDPGTHLAAVGSAFPPHVLDHATAISTLQRLFPAEKQAFIAGLVRRSGIETRYLVPSIDEVLNPASFTQRNARYRSAAGQLALRASRTALARAGTEANEIDVIIDVSCTGVAIPALDVTLSPALGLRPNVRRIPITESGCAAGALALCLAASLVQTGQRVLVVAVELCSLTLCDGDHSRTNLVASVLFGDGAAAAVLLPGGAGPRIEATESRLIEGTHAAMGFDIGTHGMRILLQRELPDILARHLPEIVDGFLDAHGRTRADIGLHLVHPGGRRILESYSAAFLAGAPTEQGLALSHESLRRYGNLSSVSILTVLELALEQVTSLNDDDEALLVGVGPGLSIELALLSWPKG